MERSPEKPGFSQRHNDNVPTKQQQTVVKEQPPLELSTQPTL